MWADSGALSEGVGARAGDLMLARDHCRWLGFVEVGGLDLASSYCVLWAMLWKLEASVLFGAFPRS